MISAIKKISTITTSAFTTLYFASPAFAQVDLNPCTKMTDANWQRLCKIGETDLGLIIGQAILVIFVIATLIALFFLIWGGIKWIMSGGDKGKVEAARSTLIAALIGLVVTFLSFFILSLIMGLFGLSLTNLNIPDIIP